MPHPKVNVIVWWPSYGHAYTFIRQPVKTDPRYLVVRVNGVEILYSSCGVVVSDCPNGLPRDAREISFDEANTLPLVVR